MDHEMSFINLQWTWEAQATPHLVMKFSDPLIPTVCGHTEGKPG